MGSLLVDLDQPVHFERFAGGLLRELIGAVAGADGDRQRVQSGLLYEFHGLVGVGEMAQAVEAGAVAVFNAAQAADFTFHGHALGMRQLHHFARRLHVVFEAGRRLPIGHQRAIHHDAGEPHVDGRLAGFDRVAVIQMQYGRDFRIEFRGRQHQVMEEAVLRVGARAAAGLHDHGRLGFPSRFHDRLDLLHVVYVEGANAVAALGCFVQKLAHRYEGHFGFSLCLH